jgi:hypothetical protein
LPLKCLNSSDCGGGFGMPNSDSDKGDEGERDHDRAFRPFEATSVGRLFQSPPCGPLANYQPPPAPKRNGPALEPVFPRMPFGGMHPAVLSQVI